MKLCVVYKSARRADTYIYLPRDKQVTDLPEALQQMLGPTRQVMLLNLSEKRNLARVDGDELQRQLTEQGYYLQLPATPENLLETHKRTLSPATLVAKADVQEKE